MTAVRFRVFVLLLLFVTAASATTLTVPSDAELAARADAIVTGTVAGSTTRIGANGYVFTDYRLDVDGVLKGHVDARQEIVISELGGSAGGRTVFVEGSAAYTQGERVLAFLRQRDDGSWYTASMSLGRFRYTHSVRGETLLVRDDELPNERARLAESFLTFLRNGAKGTVAISNASFGITADVTALAITPGAYCLVGGSPARPLRWNKSCEIGCTIPFLVSGTISGLDTSGGQSRAAAAWTNDPVSPLKITIGGASNASAPSFDNENTIFYNYGAAVTSGFCDGSQACMILTANDAVTHTFGGDTFIDIFETDIVLRPLAFSQAQYETLLTHELGHAIGLRHSDQGTPSSSSAVMASVVSATLGATLRQWDRDAIDTVYGPGAACQPPTIASTSGGGTVATGQTAALSVNASGGAPLSYQWYEGQSGNTSVPVGTNSASYTTPPITTARTFWVRVTNSCGSADSSSITVTPAQCQPPAITAQPVNVTVPSGSTTTLSVSNTGTQTLIYQWFVGQSGDTANPIQGENTRTFTTPALTQTTSYWVKITNSCGNASSTTVTVTVTGGECATPTFTQQPVNIQIAQGARTYLMATAQGAASYQWYRGAVGETSTPVAAEASANPRFVNQLYVTVLGRLPSAAEVGSFAGALTAGTQTRAQVANSVLTSSEYRTRLLTGFYTSFLQRTPGAAEVSFWLPALVSGLSDEQVAAQFLGGAEYFTLAGGTNNAWLARVYNDVLGRAIDPGALAVWNAALAGSSRGTVALQILNSAEARQHRVQQYFAAYLRRTPNAGELASFVSVVGTAGDELTQATILGSAEFVNAATLYITDPLTETTTFWVRATNGCGNANSNAAVVTIAACSAPIIVTQPQNAAVNLGQSANLSVIASANSADTLTYQWFQGNSGDTSKPVAGSGSPVLVAPPQFTAGTVSFWVRVTNRCASNNSNAAVVTSTCGNGGALTISAPAVSPASIGYVVSWNGDSRLFNKYELQESTTADFASPTIFTITDGTSRKIAAHTGLTSDKRFYYRVRGFAVCNNQPGEFSHATSTVIAAPLPANLSTYGLTAPQCDNPPCVITQPLLIGTFPQNGKGEFALDAGDTFTVTSDKPLVTVTPSSGVIGAQGTNVNFQIDASKLPVGSSEATLSVTITPAGSGKTALASRTTTIPISVSLVTPVTPLPKDNNPPPNTLMIPAIAHADGASGSHFVSDVRVTNTSTQAITYQLAFTPTAIDGTTAGKLSTITVDPGETKALNDIVNAWYGSGTNGENGIGVLEIRPMNYSGKGSIATNGTSTNPNLATIAASRTYNVASTGTFGQFVPAIPLASFLGKSDTSKISLQQVAQTTAFRTNIGFVEGSGQAVDMILTLKDGANNIVASRPYSLRAYEYQQISIPALFGVSSLANGRMEVTVTSDGGRVTAYASVLDNTTNDPLLVFPTDPTHVSSKRYVVPGIAELNNGAANFHSDMRIYNGGTQPADVELSYATNDHALPTPLQFRINPGDVKALDNILPSQWGISGSGGAVVATTGADSSLVVTARTFSRRDDGGTFGLFIPGVTSNEAVGSGERALQVVQLEQSPSFRSNLGLVEVTGKPVTIEILGHTPDSKVEARVTRDFAPGEFVQLGSIFAQMGYGNVYNGRVSVSVIGGEGRIAAYGAVVDNRTQDPTYVPAQ
jgi:hypothetical protein